MENKIVTIDGKEYNLREIVLNESNEFEVIIKKNENEENEGTLCIILLLLILILLFIDFVRNS